MKWRHPGASGPEIIVVLAEDDLATQVGGMPSLLRCSTLPFGPRCGPHSLPSVVSSRSRDRNCFRIAPRSGDLLRGGRWFSGVEFRRLQDSSERAKRHLRRSRVEHRCPRRHPRLVTLHFAGRDPADLLRRPSLGNGDPSSPRCCRARFLNRDRDACGQPAAAPSSRHQFADLCLPSTLGRTATSARGRGGAR